jgi:hypothetical protein
MYRNFYRIDFIFYFYVGMPGSCCYVVWESQRKLYQNRCWRSCWSECGGNSSFTSLSYSVRTGHWVPLSHHPLPRRPLSHRPQLLTVDWIFGGRLRGALSSTIYIKTDLKGTLGVELTDSRSALLSIAVVFGTVLLANYGLVDVDCGCSCVQIRLMEWLLRMAFMASVYGEMSGRFKCLLNMFVSLWGANFI